MKATSDRAGGDDVSMCGFLFALGLCALIIAACAVLCGCESEVEELIHIGDKNYTDSENVTEDKGTTTEHHETEQKITITNEFGVFIVLPEENEGERDQDERNAGD